MKSCTLEQVRAAKPHAVEAFAFLASVVGVGVTRLGDGYALKVNLAAPPPAEVALPTEIDGVPVRIAYVGAVEKQTERKR